MDLFQTFKMRFAFWKMSRRANPRPAFQRALLARIEGRPAPSVFAFQGLFLRRLAVPVMGLALSLVATGTYAYSSANVASGHPLYRVKRKFEAYEERLNPSPEKQARFYVRKAERRLAEAAELARDSNPESTMIMIDSLDELQRSLQAVRRIPDPARRKQAVQVFHQGDGSYLIRVQKLVLERPDELRPIARRAIANDRERLRAAAQSLQDPELRTILRAHLLTREAMLNTMLAEEEPSAEAVPETSFANF